MRVSPLLQRKKLLLLRNYKFAAEIGRGWELDFAFPEIKLGIECQGGLWMKKSGHNTGKGLQNWIDKHQDALKLRWNIYYCDMRLIKSGRAIESIEILIQMSLDPNF